MSANYLLAFNFIHLSYLHVWRYLYLYGEWTLGVDTVFMMSLCKFSTLAFNYEDGGLPSEELASSYFKDK